MPAAPSYCQSRNEATTYRLKDGGTVEVRNGCLIRCSGRRLICGSADAKQFLLDNAALSDDERQHLEEFGDGMFGSGSFTPMSQSQVQRMKYG